MRIETKCLPTGNLPYENITLATHMIAKLFYDFPYIAFLPNISQNETTEIRTLESMPGVAYKDNKLILRVGTEKYSKDIERLNKAFNNPTYKNLEKYSFKSEFLEKYLQIIKKFNSKYACVNLLGPFTISQLLIQSAKEQVLADKNFRKLFIQSICVKSLWIINKIKEFCPTTIPVIILEEPKLGQLGIIKRQDEEITVELVTNMISRVVTKLHEAGSIVGVQCFEKCDWSVPINAGVDLISFDAYNNPNNLNIMPEIITKYLQQGGMINWGIVPTISESIVKGLTVDYIANRLNTTMSGLILSGVPSDLVYKSALVSLNGNTNHLPVIFAERACMLAKQIASRLFTKS